MLKKTYTYTDWNGKERTEDFYFHLSKSKLSEMDLKKGGYAEWVKEIIAAKDNETLVETFKKTILASYGEIAPDGRRFIQSNELSEAFSQTPVYDMLFMELISSADAAAKFFNSIVPEDVKKAAEAEKAKKEQALQGAEEVVR